jgi:hypothetical protein
VAPGIFAPGAGRIEKTQKKDHIKVTVEGTKHEGKIFVQKLTEAY